MEIRKRFLNSGECLATGKTSYFYKHPVPPLKKDVVTTFAYTP